MSLVAIVTRVTRRYLPPGSGVLFDQDARRKLVLAFIGSVVLAAMELLGLGALLLLMQQLTPAADKGAVLEGISDALGDPGPRAMIAILSGLVLVVFVAKGLFALRFRWWLLHFLARQEAHTAGRLLVGYVKGPYWRVLQRKGSDLIRSMFENNNAVYGMVIGPYMLIATEGLTVLAVFVFLLFVMPIPTIAAVGFLGLAALGLNAAVRARARRLGEELSDASGRSFRAALHARFGIKEIKVRRAEGHFLDDFRGARTQWANARATMIFLGEMPRYVLEVLFIISALLVIGLLFVTAGEGQALSLIALFVAAGFRILPSVVRIVGARNTVRTGLPQMELVIKDLIDDLAASGVRELSAPDERGSRRPLTSRLELRDVHFRYPTGSQDVIAGVDLVVPAGHSVAFVGASGAGKSTLVDLVLGLHVPSSGEILVDGHPIAEDVAGWQRSIGLVPQSVYLLDASLRDNIVFGLESDGVDEDHLLDVVRRAQLTELLEELPEGLDAYLGDGGSRVSGGQRQRIGIARALYVRPSLLVLDEATSSLDNETERRVTETIESIRGSVTTIVVAHRLSTVRHCDEVLFLEGGVVVSRGTFDEVAADNESFAALVRLGRL
jgi:ATP-binding cassette, subfamily B, bacterial PglK